MIEQLKEDFSINNSIENQIIISFYESSTLNQKSKLIPLSFLNGEHIEKTSNGDSFLILI